MNHREKELIEMLLKQAGYKLEGRMYVNNDLKSAFGVKELFPDEQPLPDTGVLVEAAKGVIDRMFWTYKARNGKEMSIEDSSGEKCWIVPDEVIQLLKEALTKFPEVKNVKA